MVSQGDCVNVDTAKHLEVLEAACHVNGSPKGQQQVPVSPHDQALAAGRRLVNDLHCRVCFQGVFQGVFSGGRAAMWTHKQEVVTAYTTQFQPIT